MIKSHQFESVLKEALDSNGKIALPNVVAVADPAEGLKLLSSLHKMAPTPYRFRLRTFDPPLSTGQTIEDTYYPKIFLGTGGMGGHFNGTGAILVSGGKVYKFHMCEHDWDTTGANPRRGWHKSICRKCGFDASIDSGD